MCVCMIISRLSRKFIPTDERFDNRKEEIHNLLQRLTNNKEKKKQTNSPIETMKTYTY